MSTKCPTCGRPIKTHTFENSQRRLNNVAMSPPMPPAGLGSFSARRETPAYQPTFEANISIPFRQSIIFGLFKAPVGGVVAGSLAYLADVSSKTFDLTGWGYLVVIGGGALTVGFWVAAQEWPNRLGFYDGLLWKVEEAAQRDLDGDGYVGQPEPPHRVEVELRKNGKPWKFESLEISQDRLIKLARAVAGGQSFAERTASDHGIPRKEFNGLRDKFLSRGWAEWKGKPGSTQGVDLTNEGIDIIAEIARSPLPRSQRPYENLGDSPHAPNRTHDNNDNYTKYQFIEK